MESEEEEDRSIVREAILHRNNGGGGSLVILRDEVSTVTEGFSSLAKVSQQALVCELAVCKPYSNNCTL